MKTLDNVGSTGGTHCYTIISFINLPSNIKKKRSKQSTGIKPDGFQNAQFKLGFTKRSQTNLSLWAQGGERHKNINAIAQSSKMP